MINILISCAGESSDILEKLVSESIIFKGMLSLPAVRNKSVPYKMDVVFKVNRGNQIFKIHTRDFKKHICVTKDTTTDSIREEWPLIKQYL